MKSRRNSSGWVLPMGKGKVVVLVFLATILISIGLSTRAGAAEEACAETSNFTRTACRQSANAAYNTALGNCENGPPSKQEKCAAAAKAELVSALEECAEQFEARMEICQLIGPGPYLPNGIRPFEFVSNPKGNKYFPLNPGSIYTYKSYEANDEITETVVVKVNGTRKILGVTCRAVQDTVYEGDTQTKKIEDTTDWYAQETNGNVWYFGEIAKNFNEEGLLDNLDGSWTAGAKGAKPGIIMFAKPGDHKGVTYRQEFLLGEAEDVATVVDFLTRDQLAGVLGSAVPAVFGTGSLFLHTREFSALSPGNFEDKYYAPGVGLVLVTAPDGSKEVLVDFKKP